MYYNCAFTYTRIYSRFTAKTVNVAANYFIPAVRKG